MVLGNPCKVRIGGEQRQLEANAELGKEGVDRSHLEPASPTVVAQVGGGDVIVAFGLQEGESGESLDDPIEGSRSPKALEQLLQDQSRRVDGLSGFQGAGQR